MSAIWGKINFDQSIEKEDCEALSGEYRKKKGISFIREAGADHVYFGCGVQCITKESKNEVLPIQEENVFFTADCLLDNREELLQELSEPDSSLPDGTILYKVFRVWGVDGLKRVKGIFSAAFYESDTGTLYLCTDKTSSRCLYYCRREAAVVFSTLIYPILELFPDIQVNRDYILDFLVAPGLMPNVVPYESPYEGVMQIKPGTYMKITRDSVEEHQYWKPEPQPEKYRVRNAKQCAALFRQVYAQAVHRTMRTDGNVGLSLSSGLDSASVGALAATELQKEQKDLFTFTFVPYERTEKQKVNYYNANEQDEVMQLVKMYPNMQPEFLCNQGRNYMESLESLSRIMEVPFKAVVNMPNVSEIYEHAQEKGCKVLLSGQYGNSTVSYGRIDDILYDLYEKKKWFRLLWYVNNHGKLVKRSRKASLRYCKEEYARVKREYAERKDFDYTPENPFLASGILEHYDLKKRFLPIRELMLYKGLPTKPERYRDTLGYPGALNYIGAYETRLGLEKGIVVRDPTRDSDILEFCATISYRYFAYNGSPRWLIRGAMHDALPAAFVDVWPRFGLQNADWLLRIGRDWESLQEQLESLISDEKIAPYIDAGKCRELLKTISKENIANYEEEIFYLNPVFSLAYFFKCFAKKG